MKTQNKRQKNKFFLLLLLLLCAGPVLLSACSSSRTIITDNPEYAESYQVHGLHDLTFGMDIEIGPYIAHNIEWYWTGEIDGHHEKNEDVTKISRHYRFLLSDDVEHRWEVQCNLENNRIRIDELMPVVNNNGRSYLKCNLTSLDGSGRVASILLQNSDNKPMNGRVGYGREMIQVTGLSNGGLMRSGSKTIGYNIRLQEEIVSAVQVTDTRKVWFHSEMDEDLKNLFSATAMALLLHEEIISLD